MENEILNVVFGAGIGCILYYMISQKIAFKKYKANKAKQENALNSLYNAMLSTYGASVEVVGTDDDGNPSTHTVIKLDDNVEKNVQLLRETFIA